MMHTPSHDIGIPSFEAAARILPEMGIMQTKRAKRAKSGEKDLMDLRARAAALCETLFTLNALGLDINEPDSEDEAIASKLTASYAEDPFETSKAVSAERAATLTPATLLLVSDTLDKFGHAVVKDSMRIRHMVTNKLILESENKDARIRMKALELLGKISDVGLFVEKRVITYEDSSADDLRAKLRHKLEQLRDNAVDAEFTVVEDTPVATSDDT